jgi:hypothetical protein
VAAKPTVTATAASVIKPPLSISSRTGIRTPTQTAAPPTPPIAADNALQHIDFPRRQQQTEQHKRTDQRWHASHKLNDAPVPPTKQPQSSQPSREQSNPAPHAANANRPIGAASSNTVT